MVKDIFLLDMDDTLFDFYRTERENLISTLHEFGIVADNDIAARFHEINACLWRALERGEIKREEIVVRRFEILFSEYSIVAEAEEVARRYFDNFRKICIPFDGAQDFLARLRGLGRVYIVTNGSSVCQRQHLADAGFMPFICGVFISDEIGFAKPAEEFAAYVAEHIENFDRKRALWIGDSLTSDYECAKRGGIDFILYSASGVADGYNGRIASDYAEILDLLS